MHAIASAYTTCWFGCSISALDDQPDLQEHHLYMNLLGELSQTTKERISQRLVSAVQAHISQQSVRVSLMNFSVTMCHI